MQKILNTLILIVLIGLSTQIEKYSLAIYGDNGQISYWFKNQVTKKDKSIFDNFYDNILSQETYQYGDAFKCSVTFNGITTDLVEKDGFENFNQLNENTKIRKMVQEADGVVFMGDILYLETKKLFSDKFEEYTLLQNEKWADRLKCGWNLFFESLKRIGLAVSESEENEFLKPNSTFAIDEKIEILAGNHSQDFDLFAEEEIVSSVSQKPITKDSSDLGYSIEKISEGYTNKLFTESPRFINIEFEEFVIQFVDFNSANIFCLTKNDEKAFNKCTFSPRPTPFVQAKKYGLTLINYINRFGKTNDGSLYNKRVWKVMRAHHPPVNTEDGDSDFYFKNINVGDGQNPDKQENLWNIMKENKVNVFFGSHTHQSEVIALPYSYQYKSIKTGCEKETKWGCYLPKEGMNKFYQDPDYFEVCKNKVFYSLPINRDHDLNNDMLYVFIFGNSGRVLDSLKQGKNSAGVLLWARGRQLQNIKPKNNVFGMAMAHFFKQKLIVVFFESSPAEGNELQTSATFIVKEDELPEMDKVLQYSESKVCK